MGNEDSNNDDDNADPNEGSVDSTIGRSSNSRKNRDIRILSLDGGGARGIVQLLTLKRIFNTDALRKVKPCQCFDLIVGTSTGGIVAVLLGKLQMTIDQAVEAFEILIKKVYTPVSFPPSRYRYKASILESELKSIISRCELVPPLDPETATLRAHPEHCQVAVVARRMAYMDAPPKLFCSYNLPNSDNDCDSVPIWKALRATCAHRRFFKDISIHGVRYIDGGLVSNNPCVVAIRQAQILFPGKQIGAVYSLGTGVSRPVGADSRGIMSLLFALLRLWETPVSHLSELLQSPRSSHQEAYQICDHELKAVYFRFDPPFVGDLDADGAGMELLRVRTEAYLDDPEQLAQMRKSERILLGLWSGPSSTPLADPYATSMSALAIGPSHLARQPRSVNQLDTLQETPQPPPSAPAVNSRNGARLLQTHIPLQQVDATGAQVQRSDSDEEEVPSLLALRQGSPRDSRDGFESLGDAYFCGNLQYRWGTPDPTDSIITKGEDADSYASSNDCEEENGAPNWPPPTAGHSSLSPMTKASTADSGAGRSCGKCGCSVTGHSARACGMIYHPNCLRCFDCDTIIAGLESFPTDEADGQCHLLCAMDYWGRRDMICRRCEMPIPADYISASAHKFHIDHFTCTVCPAVFEQGGTYYEDNGEVYCLFHACAQFAVRCPGCRSPVLKGSEGISRNIEGVLWHPDCYRIQERWESYAPDPTSGASSSSSGSEGAYLLSQAELIRIMRRSATGPYQLSNTELVLEAVESLREQRKEIESRIGRFGNGMAAFEESSHVWIRQMLQSASDDNCLDACHVAEKSILRLERFVAAIEDVKASSRQLSSTEASTFHNCRILCGQVVDFLRSWSQTSESSASLSNLEDKVEQLSPVTIGQIANLLEMIFRQPLKVALELDLCHTSESALSQFLERLDVLCRDSDSESTSDDDQPENTSGSLMMLSMTARPARAALVSAQSLLSLSCLITGQRT